MTEISAKDRAAEEQLLPPVDMLDALLFPVFGLAFVLILIIFDVLQKLARLVSPELHQKVVVMLNRSLCAALRIVGVRVEVEGIKAYPLDRPIVVVANHQSLFDIPILHTIFASHYPRFISKQELGRWIPGVSFNLRSGGSALIDRSNPRQALPAIKALGERMDEQLFAAVIFPEGTRARTGKLKEFRPAGVSTLIQAASKAIIVPVVLDRSWVLSARKLGPIPRGLVVRVKVLEELDRTGFNSRELIPEAERVIRKALNDLRAS